MFRSHRARLTLAAAGSAGLLFLILFTLSTVGFRNSEIRTVRHELKPALSQILEDIWLGEKPDLREVVTSNPEISLAVYGRHGEVLFKRGAVVAPFTRQSGLLQSGSGLLLAESGVAKGETVVAVEEWKRHQDMVDRFIVLCASIWLPLVGAIALVTWFTARATFMPLERLAQEAETLSAEDLSARLRLENAGEYRDFILRLNRFLEKLEGSVRREERFLSDAAHELRTPLTVLRGEIETTLKRHRTEKEYKATLAVLAEETSRLASLVELLLRSAVATPDEDGGVSLATAAERAHARWVDRFTEKTVRLELETVEVEAGLSESEFDVIVDNLLANALRASEPGSQCSISVQCSDQAALLTVSDEGSGIPSQDFERVFDRFARGDSGRTRKDGGFGIGLALCKRVVEAHGGRIWVEPNEPHGCVFHVQLKARERKDSTFVATSQ